MIPLITRRWVLLAKTKIMQGVNNNNLGFCQSFHSIPIYLNNDCFICFPAILVTFFPSRIVKGCQGRANAILCLLCFFIFPIESIYLLSNSFFFSCLVIDAVIYLSRFICLGRRHCHLFGNAVAAIFLRFWRKPLQFHLSSLAPASKRNKTLNNKLRNVRI